MASQRPTMAAAAPRMLLLLLLVSLSQPLAARRSSADLRGGGAEEAVAAGPARPQPYMNEAPTRPADGSGDRPRRAPLLVSASTLATRLQCILDLKRHLLPLLFAMPY